MVASRPEAASGVRTIWVLPRPSCGQVVNGSGGCLSAVVSESEATSVLHTRAAWQRRQLAHRSGFYAQGRVCLERTCFTAVAMVALGVVPGLTARDASA